MNFYKVMNMTKGFRLLLVVVGIIVGVTIGLFFRIFVGRWGWLWGSLGIVLAVAAEMGFFYISWFCGLSNRKNKTDSGTGLKDYER
jgi:hypothetical protein